MELKSQRKVGDLKNYGNGSLLKHTHFGLTRGKATVKILKFGTPETIAIIVLKIEKFDLTLH